jgi:outer membrane protein assembly factor BamB
MQVDVNRREIAVGPKRIRSCTAVRDRSMKVENIAVRRMRRWVRALVVASCLSGVIALASAPAYATDWTQFHFGAAQRGANPFETVLTPATVGGLQRHWRVDVSGAIGSTSALVVGNKTIVGTSARLRAYTTATGFPLWNLTTVAPIKFGIAEAAGVVYANEASTPEGSPGPVIAVDAASGHLIWSRALGGSELGGPVVAGDVVYTGGGTDLYALDAGTGATLWQQTPYAPQHGGVTTPAVADGLVVVGANFPIVAYHAEDGTLAWEHDLGVIFSGPAISGGGVYTSEWGTLYKLDLATGRTIWQRSLASGSIVYSAPAVANGMVFYHVFRYHLSDLIIGRSAKTGKFVWAHALPVGNGGGWSSPSVAGGVVYVGGRDGRIRAYRATNGAALWSRLLNGPISSTPSIANGQVEIGTDAGRLYAFALP